MVFERLRALPSVPRNTKPALGGSEVRPGSDETFPSPPTGGAPQMAKRIAFLPQRTYFTASRRMRPGPWL